MMEVILWRKRMMVNQNNKVKINKVIIVIKNQ
jgi:hypothetical protein